MNDSFQRELHANSQRMAVVSTIVGAVATLVGAVIGSVITVLVQK